MKRNDILKIVNEVFIDIFEEQILIKEDFTSNDINGWDSLTHIMLVVNLEKKFEIKFFSNEIGKWTSIKDIIDSISEKL